MREEDIKSMKKKGLLAYYNRLNERIIGLIGDGIGKDILNEYEKVLRELIAREHKL